MILKPHCIARALSVLLVTILPSTLFAQETEAPKDWRAGEIQSVEEFEYGKFSSRIYCSNLSGTISTFFLFANLGWSDEDNWQEIDFEMFGRDGAYEWQTNVIYQSNPTANNTMNEKHQHTAFSVGEGWHTFTIEWSPEKILWLIDDDEYYRFEDGGALGIINGPLKMMFNLWTHKDGWGGTLDDGGLPAYQFMDWVSYYPHTGGHTFADEPTFFDDFKDLDNWSVSTHSWEENRATFDTNNVGIINEDIAVLALSYKTGTGISPFHPAKLSEDTTYSISTHNESDCITLSQEETIVLEPCANSKAQIWHFTYAREGYHYLTHALSGKTLGVDGSVVTLSDIQGDDQQFRVIWIKGSDNHHFFPKGSIIDETEIRLARDGSELTIGSDDAQSLFVIKPAALPIESSAESSDAVSSFESSSNPGISSLSSAPGDPTNTSSSSEENPEGSDTDEESSEEIDEELDTRESSQLSDESSIEERAPLLSANNLPISIVQSSGAVTIFNDNVIIELFTLQGTVLNSVKGPNSVNYSGLEAGVYIISMTHRESTKNTFTALQIH
ncbi:MAG: family 16 glycosylhydrolase [Fibrobacterales bacterium]